MVRDFRKTAEKAHHKIPDYYDLYSTEIIDLMKQARDRDPEETYEAILTAFRYGFVLGHRATTAGRVTKRL